MPAPKGHKAYKGCETGGRPRKFSRKEIDRFAIELMEWMHGEDNFWLKDFCLKRDINPDYMAEWARENKKFRGAHEMAKHMQESKILNGAMLNMYSGTIAKFTLANCHGWVDKQETKISGDAANPLKFILDAVSGKTKDLVTND